ncbi:hypothetical protein Slin15195_G100090 [Septoria linicola]|uniref:Uncharacterized protein n=1 Tax=Septoria linicola TaxID=215465 RepID=A0A9Q9AX07_9PEZI|nr:hypothetical protein Slin15195_G100090 [Septoria linicola]
MDKIKAGSQMNMPDERSAVQSTSRQGIGPPPPRLGFPLSNSTCQKMRQWKCFTSMSLELRCRPSEARRQLDICKREEPDFSFPQLDPPPSADPTSLAESLQDQQSDPSELSTTTQSPPRVWRVVCQLRRPELTEEEKAAEAVDNAAISQALAQHFAMMRSDPAVARRRLGRPVAASSAEQSVPGAARNVFAGQHGKLGPLVSSSAEPDGGLDNSL